MAVIAQHTPKQKKEWDKKAHMSVPSMQRNLTSKFVEIS